MSSYVNAEGVGAESLRDCPGFLDRYRSFLVYSSGVTAVTVSDQILCLREFLRFVHYYSRFGFPSDVSSVKELGVADMSVQELASVDESVANAYLTWMDTIAGNSVRTVEKKVSYIRRFFNYLIASRKELGLPVLINPMTNMHFGKVTSQAHSKVIPFASMQEIICGANTGTANRDRAILLLFATVGLRSSELSGLNQQDLLSGGRLRIAASSLCPERIVTMTSELQEAVKLYLAPLPEVAKIDTAPLFASSLYPYGRLTSRALCKIVRQAAERAGFQDITPNDLRETASRCLFNAAPMGQEWAVYALLGLSDKQNNRLDLLRSERFEGTAEVFKSLILSSEMAALRAYPRNRK